MINSVEIYSLFVWIRQRERIPRVLFFLSVLQIYLIKVCRTLFVDRKSNSLQCHLWLCILNLVTQIEKNRNILFLYVDVLWLLICNYFGTRIRVLRIGLFYIQMKLFLKHLRVFVWIIEILKYEINKFIHSKCWDK